MSDTAAIQKQLKIKSGVVQRLAKEAKLYIKETGQLTTRKAKLVADGAEEWDIKNATKMVDESEKMEIDTKTRLDKAIADLKQLIVAAKEDAALKDNESLLKAEETINNATA
ncbi:hypothetical protein HYPSUDRAFT_705142 [Hypholoma sublateritium FD-334 SS-4]|uniref:Tubulin-specific chaperone A n=1 Tax=Hypholoma sublateritium (strain FD-334 SS-4) TaxID=945553 RepID=A0A0D2MWQ5_HYPSF|nr:hypothetical protein HYPSUDRAFT_705142 [Hypholoma sublateritium FD-334 SS-4]